VYCTVIGSSGSSQSLMEARFMNDNLYRSEYVNESIKKCLGIKFDISSLPAERVVIVLDRVVQ